MAVTDLSDMANLPWWARQGPGPTGGPAAAPQGASQAWLQYLSQMFGGGNPANMPSPSAQNVNMIDFGNPDPSATGPGPGNVGPVDLSGGFNPPPADPNQLNPNSLAARARAIQQPPAPVPPVPPGYLGSTGATNGAPVGNIGLAAPVPGYLGSTGAGGGDPRAVDAAMNQIAGMAPGVVNPGYRPPGITPGRTNPNAPAANAAPVSAINPAATGGASAQGATSNPRFVPVDRPNMSAAGGFGRGGPPQMTALNLAGLFGGGQPAAAANPANVPAPNAQPVSGRVAGPLSQGAVNRLAANYPGRLQMSPDQLSTYIHTQPWLQNLGGAAAQQMTPAQLAALVKGNPKSWWQNLL